MNVVPLYLAQRAWVVAGGSIPAEVGDFFVASCDLLFSLLALTLSGKLFMGLL